MELKLPSILTFYASSIHYVDEFDFSWRIKLLFNVTAQLYLYYDRDNIYTCHDRNIFQLSDWNVHFLLHNLPMLVRRESSQ